MRYILVRDRVLDVLVCVDFLSLMRQLCLFFALKNDRLTENCYLCILKHKYTIQLLK